jgi:hypothetical protein
VERAVELTAEEITVAEDRLADLAAEVRGAASTLSSRIHGRAKQA